MLKSKAWDRRQAHLLREKRKRESKDRREAQASEVFIPSVMLTHEAILNNLAQRRKLPMKSLRELRAENQERQAEMLGTLAVFLLSFGWEDDAAVFFVNAFGKAQNAWRLRNPEPMMQAVHNFWVDKQVKVG
jgi:hypothetical protein